MLKHATEVAKQRSIAMAHKLRRNNAINEQYGINRTFSSTPGRVCQELAEKARTGAVPDKGQCEEIWKEIWSNPTRHNEGTEWMVKLRNSPEFTNHENLSALQEYIDNKRFTKWLLNAVWHLAVRGITFKRACDAR